MGTNPVCLSVFYRDSLQKGWEMIAICLYFFPPSTKFSGYLEGIIAKHLDETNNIIQTEVGNGQLSAEAVLSMTVFRLQKKFFECMALFHKIETLYCFLVLLTFQCT